MNDFFGRLDENGNVAVFHRCGEAATRLNKNVYPIGSDVSAYYEHPNGIILTADDAKLIGIEVTV